MQVISSYRNNGVLSVSFRGKTNNEKWHERMEDKGKGIYGCTTAHKGEFYVHTSGKLDDENFILNLGKLLVLCSAIEEEFILDTENRIRFLQEEIKNLK